ncbi:PRD domain-containing protein [Cellulomonas triticagri]|uniref:PRD domain-containing protein n=1 Tax=Cellulomonas triticagri TaxID=2483352 RepID=A0A3M2JDC3_9CELL|nr:PRD domain-containing protein [Cellulomonas triticagri]RMI09593.1 PRD domain-containing protein [Cellulomonas triticagri]
MRVMKILNNNAVVASEGDRDIVAMGLGIAYQYPKGADLPREAAERVFVASTSQPIEKLGAFLTDIPLENIRIATQICESGDTALTQKPPQAMIVAIADHITFACQRARDGIPLENPLKWEIQQLYPQELAIGRRGVELIRQQHGIDLPDDEAASIALHLVNAQFTETGLHRGVRMTETVAQILDIVDRTFDVEVDRASMSATRFVTHLRYVFARLDSGKQIEATPGDLVASIAQVYPEAYACAGRICFLLGMAFDAEVEQDERAFVTLHVARLLQDARSVRDA